MKSKRDEYKDGYWPCRDEIRRKVAAKEEEGEIARERDKKVRKKRRLRTKERKKKEREKAEEKRKSK